MLGSFLFGFDISFFKTIQKPIVCKRRLHFAYKYLFSPTHLIKFSKTDCNPLIGFFRHFAKKFLVTFI